eukprot:scaffold8649_cov33-Phaeocystis_antarctica.AAC.1
MHGATQFSAVASRSPRGRTKLSRPPEHAVRRPLASVRRHRWSRDRPAGQDDECGRAEPPRAAGT